ncbi:MAG: 4-hydroxy-tetrahydrodipicolinate reductase [Chloroflexi bacterium]|nr:MAG: 4-hydroxy-tetrahydrodipicolinate reductase [Chloroflexota bacterium]RLC97467.1 MAG: 4-hydroxy-tetrahydrodipicolinate reductase [Chloroflexota bacterium]
MSVRVVVQGALGRMGREVINALCSDSEATPVGAVDARAEDAYLSLPDHSGSIPLSAELKAILEQTNPDVLVDFSVAEAALAAARVATGQGVHLVIGTTGLSPDNLADIDEMAKSSRVGAVVAPNFALGAILMIHLARLAARYFDHCEIIEMHHDQKLDAPSGTALSTARAIREAKQGPFVYPRVHKESLSGTRGGQLDGIAVHSVRLPGLLAHQEVIFGTAGQTLSIRHDTINRECYMPGVLLAVKRVGEHKGLVYGLDRLLGL